jgi:hypothetical protein
MCQPDSTPHGISVRTCTIALPEIEDDLCWISVRLSLPASASDAGSGFAIGMDDIVKPPYGLCWKASLCDVAVQVRSIIAVLSEDGASSNEMHAVDNCGRQRSIEVGSNPKQWYGHVGDSQSQ